MADRVTMADVARSLGVSTATVSNAFNRPDQLSKGLRREVLRRAEELGYPGPDPTARSLRTGRAGVVAVAYSERLSFAFAEPSTVAFLEGLTQVAEEDELGVLLLPAASDDPEHDGGGGLARAVSTAAADGFVIFSMAANAPALAAVRRRGRPAVVVDSPSPADVTVDDEGGAEAAMRHVLSLGHRRIAVISFRIGTDGSSGPAASPRRRATPFAVTTARFGGYERALAAAAEVDPTVPTWDEVPVFEVGDHHDEKAVRAGVTDLLTADPRPTALVATGDFLAIAALAVARALSIEVPTELSVVGFDDVPLAAHTDPPLTTVLQPSQDKGVKAGRLLLRSLAGESTTGEPIVLPTELVVRGSTAPPPTD